MKFESLCGIAIHYEVKGVGTPFLLLPPKGFDQWIWKHQVSELSDKFTLIMPCWPRLDDIQYSKNALTIHDLANALTEFINHVAKGPVHIFGVGLGGLVAQCIAVEYPESVLKLVLSSTPKSSPGFYEDDNEALNLYFKTGRESGSDILGKATELELYPCENINVIKDIAQLKANYFPDKRSYQELLLAEAAFEMEGRVGRIISDTFVIIGEEDKIVPIVSQENLCDAIPGARKLYVSEAGHLGFVTSPKQFNEAILEFLTM